MLDRPLKLLNRHQDLPQACVDLGLASIEAACSHDILLVFVDVAQQRLQHLSSLRECGLCPLLLCGFGLDYGVVDVPSSGRDDGFILEEATVGRGVREDFAIADLCSGQQLFGSWDGLLTSSDGPRREASSSGPFFRLCVNCDGIGSR